MASVFQTEELAVYARPLRLDLTAPFRIAHGSSTHRTNVLVRVGEGIGEAALPPYYGLTAEQAVASISGLRIPCPLRSGVPLLRDTLRQLPDLPAQTTAAIDIALHDHWAKALGMPLYQLLGLNPEGSPPTARTIGITTNRSDLKRDLDAKSAFQLLKLKLGSGDLEADIRTVETVLDNTESSICVDANGGWSPEEAAVVISRLPENRTAFVEEPVSPGERHSRWKELFALLGPTHPPLIADESVQTTDDVLELRGIADGINIKLAKAGGIARALELFTLARALGMRTLLGCMIESSIAVTAAAHLASLADFVDLDATLNLAADPFQGITFDGERLHVPDLPGIGVTTASATPE
jgi:L-alanine-DL-glutamate epimerase-like enolase superfamily enzyme